LKIGRCKAAVCHHTLPFVIVCGHLPSDVCSCLRSSVSVHSPPARTWGLIERAGNLIESFNCAQSSGLNVISFIGRLPRCSATGESGSGQADEPKAAQEHGSHFLLYAQTTTPPPIRTAERALGRGHSSPYGRQFVEQQRVVTHLNLFHTNTSMHHKM
jgi:hypothetical protein